MTVVPSWVLMLMTLVGLATAAPVALATEVLVDPQPIAVPSGLTDKIVAKSIRLGIAQRGWVVSKQEPGFMEATLNLRSHVAKVGITYDTKTIQIRYLESTNLDYEEKKGVRRIHGNYLKWISNIVRDINLQLQAAEAELTDATETPRQS
jgi:hypothetical protein